ncbi:MAG: Omp28 family outer membrane lipoprotein [Muribaculaceae bacterium]|nr:Omp28 family outer membrane lipoprotein [Muribaculaceae bacterium]
MKATHLILGLLILTGFVTGCDNISEDDRYIKVEKPSVNRSLLIMEFTGNNCMNCPLGAEEVEKIKLDEGPDRVISVGLHPEGNYNTDPVQSLYPTPGTLQDLRCKEATELFKYYNPGGFPTAIFNGLKSSMASAIGDWMTKASDAIQVPSYITLNAICDYDETSRTVKVTYDATFSDVLNESISVAVWIVENGIRGTQRMPDGKMNLNYVHNHVLRTSLNGAWGENIGDSFTQAATIEKSASTTLSPDWVAENCDIIVFALRDDNKEVEQAISLKIEN